MTDLSREDRLLLGLLQDGFPLSVVPYTDLGERLGWAESQVLARIADLKRAGPLRQIGAIFDTRRLGYASTLAALAVEGERLDDVAAAVSRHPGVSHNYARAHHFNLWFTLAVPPGGDLEGELRTLATLPGVREAMVLPTLRAFKIDVRFDLSPGGTTRPVRPRMVGEPALAPEDIPFVRALQEDLPLVQRPFHALAQREGLEEDTLLAAAQRLLAAGIMRRYGATLRHRQAGYTANAMAAWQVPEERVEAAGRAAAALGAVSHCYERPARPPAWPYQLFTMVHARSRAQLEQALAELRGVIRPIDMAVLETVKEYKKVRLRYFEDPQSSTGGRG